MPGTTWAYSRSTGTWVEGLWQNSPDEIDPQAAASVLDGLFPAWPHAEFWIQLSRVQLWSEFRADKPAHFRNSPMTAGYYTWGTNQIDLHSAQWQQNRAGVMAHEVGHMFQDLYRLGAWHDDIGQKLWALQCKVAGTDDLEEFAHNVGRILLRRLSYGPGQTVPKGFEHLMDYIRQVRS